jgi:hypothetical protein
MRSMKFVLIMIFVLAFSWFFSRRMRAYVRMLQGKGNASACLFYERQAPFELLDGQSGGVDDNHAYDVEPGSGRVAA